MRNVIIEVDEHDVAALRGAMPDLFDARSLVEAGIVLTAGAGDRAAEDLDEVGQIAETAGWPADQVASLRTALERAIDAITRVLMPEAVQVDVRDEADSAETTRGPVWSSRRVTVVVANKDSLVAAVAPWARELERFHTFVGEAEERVAELHRRAIILEGSLLEGVAQNFGSQRES